MSTLLRKDIPAARKWDPSHIYATQEEWEKDFEWIKEQTGKLAAMAGTLSQGRDQVLAALKLYAEVGEHISRLYTNASTNLNSDNGDAFYQGLGARAMSLYSQFAAAAAFISPELLTLDSETLNAYIADPAFSDYDAMLKDLERMSPHTLST